MIQKYLRRLIIYFENLRSRCKRKKEVLIMVHNELMFEYAILYYDLLSKNRNIKTYLTFSHPGFLIKKSTIQQKQKDYNFKLMHIKIVPFIKWDLILYPDHHHHFKFHFKEILKVFVGHGLYTGNKKDGEIYSFDYQYTLTKNSELFYDHIFIRSKYEQKFLSQKYPLLKETFIITGSLMLDSIKKPKKDILNQRKTILITSTWGPTSLIQSQADKICDILKNLTETYDMKISIHPNNNKKDSIKKILENIQRIDNVDFTTKPSEAHKFLSQADLLITDHTSLGLYFLKMNKPIICFKNKKVHLSEDAPFFMISKRSLLIDNLDHIKEDIKNAFQNYKTGHYQDILDKYINHVENSDKITENKILSLLNIE